MLQRIDYYLNKARPYYTQACNIIRDLSNLASIRNKQLSYEQTMIRFDTILQTVMLSVAVEDGSFSELDEQFLRRLTQYGDAMVIINQEAQKYNPNWRMTWGGISAQSPHFSQELADYAVRVMEAQADAFAKDFAPVDSMVSRDYLKELRDCMLEIMTVTSLVDDGNVTAAHNLKSVAVADKLLTEKWAKYLQYTTGRSTGKTTGQTTQKTTGQTTQKTTTQKKADPKPAGDSNQINLESEHKLNHVSHRERYTNAIIFIENYGKNFISYGSGVIITRSGFALTCAHVVEGATKLMAKVSTVGKEPVFVPATVHSVDKKNDLALIKLREGTYYYADLDMKRTEPVLGENIAIYGYPFGANMSDSSLQLNVSYCRGYVASNQTMGGLRRTLLDITARSGNSGSPVTSLDNGKVIGIYFGGYCGDPKKQDDKICGMTPMKYVHELLLK